MIFPKSRAEDKLNEFCPKEAFLTYGRQWIDDEDIESVVRVLRSDWLTQGPKVEEFEQVFAEYTGARYAVAVINGTAALHLACMAAGFGQGDTVITSPITFAATSNGAVSVGAWPAFVDIDAATFNLDPPKLEEYLASWCESKTKEPTPRAVIPVHYAGLPCNMVEIHRIARKYNLIIIEDACHALGAQYRLSGAGGEVGRADAEDWIKVGSCTHSDMTIFSFHPVKHITTGEGGMITTNDKALYRKLLMLRNHGITRDPDEMQDHNFLGKASSQSPAWYYEMQALGANYRITDLQCGLGLSQLKKAERFVERRRAIAQAYSEFLKDSACFRPQSRPNGFRSSYHLYVIRIESDDLSPRDVIMHELRQMGIGTQVHYIPVYRHPFYRRLLPRTPYCPESESFFAQCLSIPMYPSMSDQDVERVLKGLETVGRRL